MLNKNLKNQFLNNAKQIFTNADLILNNKPTHIVSVDKVSHEYVYSKLIRILVYVSVIQNDIHKNLILNFDHMTDKFDTELQPKINTFVADYKQAVVEDVEADIRAIDIKYHDDRANGRLSWQQNN